MNDSLTDLTNSVNGMRRLGMVLVAPAGETLPVLEMQSLEYRIILLVG